MAEFFASVDTALMGRKTFQKNLKLGGGSFGSPMKSSVLSKSGPAAERQRVNYTHLSPARLIAQIRKERGKNIWADGRRVVRSFLKADLVDELQIALCPCHWDRASRSFQAAFRNAISNR